MGHRDCARVLGIDPGSRTLGISILDYFPYEGKLELVEAWTLVTEQAIRNNRWRTVLIGEHEARLEAISAEILTALKTHAPDAVAMEIPYLKRLPQTFSVLTQVMRAIEYAVKSYSLAMPLAKYDPSTVKKAIGVPGNSPDKTLVYKAVSGLACLENVSGRSLESLSEHAIDATAVAHCYCVDEFDFLNLGQVKAHVKRNKK